jgi:hypothetical protein
LPEEGGFETTRLLVAVWFAELRFNARAFPGAIAERYLKIKVRSYL